MVKVWSSSGVSNSQAKLFDRWCEEYYRNNLIKLLRLLSLSLVYICVWRWFLSVCGSEKDRGWSWCLSLFLSLLCSEAGFLTEVRFGHLDWLTSENPESIVWPLSAGLKTMIFHAWLLCGCLGYKLRFSRYTRIRLQSRKLLPVNEEFWSLEVLFPRLHSGAVMVLGTSFMNPWIHWLGNITCDHHVFIVPLLCSIGYSHLLHLLELSSCFLISLPLWRHSSSPALLWFWKFSNYPLWWFQWSTSCPLP